MSTVVRGLVRQSDRTALMTVREGWVGTRAEIDAARTVLDQQLLELENPDTWECREARRVQQMLRKAGRGLSNRIAETDELIAHIDVELRTAT